MEPVRLAIIGAGQIGTRHAELMQDEPNCRLIAIADPSLLSEKVSVNFDIPRYEDYEEMLREEKPDGVVVATPNQMHVPVGIACAEKGVHILMEKPIGDSVSAGKKLVDAVNQSGVKMTVGHHRRFDPSAKAAREILDAGKIGSLQAVSATWAVRKHDEYYEAEWRCIEGGGPVLLNLIHDIDMLRHLCGEIATVYADLSTNARGLDVEDTAAIVIRFTSGTLATIAVSDATPSPWGWELATGENPQFPATGKNCYQFMGTKGSFGFPHIEFWRHPEENSSDWKQPIIMHKQEKFERAAMADQLTHFCQMIREGEIPCVSGEDGLATLAATEAVKRSAIKAGPVVPEFTL